MINTQYTPLSYANTLTAWRNAQPLTEKIVRVTCEFFQETFTNIWLALQNVILWCKTISHISPSTGNAQTASVTTPSINTLETGAENSEIQEDLPVTPALTTHDEPHVHTDWRLCKIQQQEICQHLMKNLVPIDLLAGYPGLPSLEILKTSSLHQDCSERIHTQDVAAVRKNIIFRQALVLIGQAAQHNLSAAEQTSSTLDAVLNPEDLQVTVNQYLDTLMRRISRSQSHKGPFSDSIVTSARHVSKLLVSWIQENNLQIPRNNRQIAETLLHISTTFDVAAAQREIEATLAVREPVMQEAANLRIRIGQLDSLMTDESAEADIAILKSASQQYIIEKTSPEFISFFQTNNSTYCHCAE